MSRFLAIILISVGLALGQGGTGVITLVMPPPGGDGYSALQTGGAFPTGATSLYYNPALLPALERGAGSQLHFTKSHQDLLPVLQFDDLEQDFWSAAAAFPLFSGFSAGLGLFRNHVSFGENMGTDSGFASDETVYGLGAGLGADIPLPPAVLPFLAAGVSAGGSIKYYDSRLTSGASGRANGFAFDAGLFGDARLTPFAGAGIRSFEANFALGVAWQNMGSDVWYADPEATDPLPRQRRTSQGLTLRFFDMAEAAFGRDWEHDTHRRVPADEPAVRTHGQSLSVLGFRYGRAELDDPTGERREIHKSRSFEISALQVHRIWRRVKTGDFTSASASLDAGFPFGKTTFLGLPFRANPRVVFGKRRIIARDDGIRDGQEAVYWSVGI